MAADRRHARHEARAPHREDVRVAVELHGPRDEDDVADLSGAQTLGREQDPE